MPELGANGSENIVAGPYSLADDEIACVFESLPDLLASRDLTDAGMPGIVGQDHEVAREERAVRAAQIEKHTVPAGDGGDLHGRDNRRTGKVSLHFLLDHLLLRRKAMQFYSAACFAATSGLRPTPTTRLSTQNSGLPTPNSRNCCLCKTPAPQSRDVSGASRDQVSATERNQLQPVAGAQRFYHRDVFVTCLPEMNRIPGRVGAHPMHLLFKTADHFGETGISARAEQNVVEIQIGVKGCARIVRL